MTSPVDLNDVQGDVILGFPKRVENFIFFTIAKENNGAAFRKIVGSEQFLNFITTSADIHAFRQKIRAKKAQSGGRTTSLIRLAAVNIAFTQTGLEVLGITEGINDDSFKAGQLARAKDLGDGKLVNGMFDPGWAPEFRREIDGIILIAGECEQSMRETETRLLSLLGNTISQVFKVCGKARPGDQKGHEHFGYLDGVSDPAVKDIVDPFPGQHVVDPGVLLLGQPGDPEPVRPSWTKNGSILVYRHLDQLVPEFDQFKHKNALFPELIGYEKGAELLGARLFGRWKSGAPIDLTPLEDNKELAANPEENNNFDFSKVLDQTNCPFAAHIRKTNPRSDIGPEAVARHSIKRSGIPFGEEVTPAERSSQKTELKRGLAFVCYQSKLSNGFEFMQERWANNPEFIGGKPQQPGFDPIIGQDNGNPRQMNGYNPQAQANNLPLPIEFVISRGGAYFFSPSITALKTKIGTQ